MALASAEVQAIGTTTLGAYRRYEERDSGLEHWFQPVMVDAPSRDECLQILRGLRNRYETHYVCRVEITDDALTAAVELADRHISDRSLPQTALDLIDDAAARTYLKWGSSSRLQQRIETTRREKDAAIEAQEFEKAADLYEMHRWLTNDRRVLDATWRLAPSGERAQIGEPEIADVLQLHAHRS